MQSLYLDVYIYALSSSMNPNILIFTDNLNNKYQEQHLEHPTFAL